MTTLEISPVLKRIIQILNANRDAFDATVSNTGAFPFIDDIELAAFEADEMVATQGYFGSVNKSLAAAFEVSSARLTSGDGLPFHHGNYRRVDLAKNLKNFVPADVNTSNNTITIAAHGFATGDIVQITSTETLPAPVSPSNVYYVLAASANLLYLYTEPFNTTSLVDLTTQGSGIHTITGWVRGIEAESLDDITNAVANAGYFESGAFKHLFKIHENKFYSPAVIGRVFYPEYTRGEELQCSQNEEWLVICTAVRMLTRNASPAPFEFYTDESVRGIRQLQTDGMYTAQGEMQ